MKMVSLHVSHPKIVLYWPGFEHAKQGVFEMYEISILTAESYTQCTTQRMAIFVSHRRKVDSKE